MITFNQVSKRYSSGFEALKQVSFELEKGEIKSLALPRLATGVGGLEWDEVFPLIKSHLGELKIPVFVYTHYQMGVEANEAGL